MAVQILSDLHLEYPQGYDTFEVVPVAPYLALLGDIGLVAIHKEDLSAFFTRMLRQFRAVLFVPGNHETYRSNWGDTLRVLREFEQYAHNDSSLGEFVLLDRTSFRIPDTNIIILGCSLFSNVPPDDVMAVRMGLNDFFQTKQWGVADHNEAFRRDIDWLNSQVTELETSDVKVMIMSHWSPSKDERAIDPIHVGSTIGSAFSTDLSEEVCFKSPKVRLWAFGHTHYNCDFMVERVDGAGPLRLVTNQRGYYFDQAKGFDAEKAVSV